MGGLGKFWDGYDNQPVVVIDDPSMFDPKMKPEGIDYFKNLISVGEMIVEVKCGSMQMDSPLIIMSSNFDPDVLAGSAGPRHQDAIYDRIAGSRSIARKAIEVLTAVQAHKRLPFQIINLVVKLMYDLYDVEINTQTCMDTIVHTKWSTGYSAIFD